METWLTVIGIAWAVLSGLVIWGFLGGKFVQQNQGDRESIQRIEKMLNDERLDRRAFTERVNVDLGRIATRMELLEEKNRLQIEYARERTEAVVTRQGRVETRIEELQRQIDRQRGRRHDDTNEEH